MNHSRDANAKYVLAARTKQIKSQMIEGRTKSRDGHANPAAQLYGLGLLE